MFCFITSLRAPQASANWPRVCELFERTAASVFAQTDANFRLIVAGHAPPVLRRQFDARLEFIAADLPVPENTYPARDLDKRVKLILALRRARALGAAYVMSIDADDLVSNRLAEFALSDPHADGWYAGSGYQHEYGRPFVEPVTTGFNYVCGSCNILANRWFSFPDDEEREREVERLWFIGGHATFEDLFGALGARIRSLPFPAVTYVAHGGERMQHLNPQNLAPPRPRWWLRRLAGKAWLAALTVARRRPLTAKIRNEFSIGGALAE